MCYRIIEGLEFYAHSPSRLELVSVNNDMGADDRVFVEYDGSVWKISYHAGDGHIIFRNFAARDYAIRMIANRRPQVVQA